MFFNLIDVALVNNHFAYMKLGNDILLLNFKIAVAEALIGRYKNRKRSFPTSRPNKRNLINHHVQRSPNLHARILGEAKEISLLQE